MLSRCVEGEHITSILYIETSFLIMFVRDDRVAITSMDYKQALASSSGYTSRQVDTVNEQGLLTYIGSVFRKGGVMELVAYVNRKLVVAFEHGENDCVEVWDVSEKVRIGTCPNPCDNLLHLSCDERSITGLTRDGRAVVWDFSS